MGPTSGGDFSTREQEASRVLEVLRNGTTQSGIDLFAAYGITLALATAGAEVRGIDSMAFLSISGFAGPQLSGFVVLGTTETMLRRSNDTPSSPGDWMAELGNQLIGRIKNRLYREGIGIHRVPPAVVKGCAHALLYARAGVIPVTLTCGEDVVFIWTQAEPSVGDNDVLAPDLDPGVLAEGELVLF